MSKGVVLITGASAGLGAEMARQFAALGYDLALCARREDRLAQLRQEITARHPELRIRVRPLDVTDDAAVFAVFRAFAAELGRVDRVVVNAGYIRSERNEHVRQRTRFIVDTPTGVRSIVGAIGRRRAKAYVPAWPWLPLGVLLRRAPLWVVRKMV